MARAQRVFDSSEVLLVAVVLLLAAALCAAGPARAAGNLESFDFKVTNAGGVPTEQAGGRPDQTSTSFTYASHEDASGLILPFEEARNLAVELPAGMVGNATAVATCSGSELVNETCPDNSAVGTVELEIPRFGFCATCGLPGVIFPLYNVQPPPGVPAEFGFKALRVNVVHLVAQIHSEPEYGIKIVTRYQPQTLPFTGVKVTFWGVPADPSHDPLRGSCLSFLGSIGSCENDEPVVRPFLANPTSCTPTLTATASIDYWTTPGVFDTASASNENGSGEVVPIEGCDQPAFDPTLEAQPTTDRADSPSGLDVRIHVPQNEDPERVASAHLKDATLTLPPGLTINPASAGGLGACSPAQVGLRSAVGDPHALFDEDPVSCPDASKLGTVEVDTPLIATPLHGAVYLASQDRNPFGSLLALYVVVEDPQTGVLIKLAGHPVADPQTGRLTVSFEQNPQLPFEDLKVDLFPGQRAALKTPASCGEFTTTSELTPWTSPEGAEKTPTDSFAISHGAGGSGCLKSDSEAANAPSFKAGTADPTAGAFSPFVLRIGREDGSQPLRAIDATLPEGLLGRLAGVPYCSEADIQAAEHKPSGKAEQASPSCPSSSLVGSVDVGAGAGSDPIYVSGKAYLAGPYKGAPLSLVAIVPAVAGPFDLGNVVVRNALYLDPETTRIHAVSDPLPTILQGIPLDLRSIALKVDRPNFTLNPTDCNPLAITGAAISVFDQSAALSNPFQAERCGRLKFKPSLRLAFKGRTKRTGNPAVTAVLKAPKGEANIAATTVILSRSEFIDNAHISTPCTRVQFNAGACPKGSILGTARAFTPLLDQPLEGPVYFRSNGGERELPDLVADLNGQIHVTLVGFIDSVPIKGTESSMVRTRFQNVPDAPVSKFVLKLKGGKRGLIQNSRDLCSFTPKAKVRMTAQNGKVHDFAAKIGTSCGKAKKGARRHGR